MEVFWVSDLIDANTRSWKKELILDIFTPMDADAILSIHLSLFPKEDRVMWGKTKNGEFSVRSTYHLLKNEDEEAFKNLRSSSRSHKWELIEKSSWKLIWNTKTLPKIRSFLWRMCAQGLASVAPSMKSNC
ncbi:hypothetical protein NE237_021204 [Protea cynaroides]|uniref:Reverse transcriptase zinc-binding domain-containing protein n=1 Tax=Protea cynaroides TaxID=273540 RepID=A0A9Q0K2D9_9MAGN|nr:hypothetical protein NE237_021204 [Protea cynaroides]